MILPAFRILVDAAFRTTSIDARTLASGPPDAWASAAARAGSEVGELLLEAFAEGLKHDGRLRDVAQRFLALASDVVIEGRARGDAPAETRALFGAALFGCLAGMGGPEAFGRYALRFGTISDCLAHDLLMTAERAAERREAVEVAVRDLTLPRPSSGHDPVREVIAPPLASVPVGESHDALDGSSDPGGEAPPIVVRGVTVPTIWSAEGRRLYHGPLLARALGYANPTTTLTDLARRDPSVVQVVSHRDVGGSRQRRDVRFLTAEGFLLAMTRVTPGMSSHREVRALVLNLVARVTGASAVDVVGMDRRHARAVSAFSRAHGVARARVARLEGLVAGYVGEVAALATELDEAKAGEVRRRRHLADSLGAVDDELAELRVRVELLEDELRLLRAENGELRAGRERMVRERHGLDVGGSIGPRGGAGRPRH